MLLTAARRENNDSFSVFTKLSVYMRTDVVCVAKFIELIPNLFEVKVSDFNADEVWKNLAANHAFDDEKLTPLHIQHEQVNVSYVVLPDKLFPSDQRNLDRHEATATIFKKRLVCISVHQAKESDDRKRSSGLA